MLPTENISKHFTWAEAATLPSWHRLAVASDGLDDTIIQNLKDVFAKMDLVRDHFGMPLVVHCAYRPEEYNKLVGGAPNSAHKFGKAVDFHVMGSTCDAVRKNILDGDLLTTWNLRMENLPGSSWIHLGNDYAEGHNRFFIP